MTLFKTCNSCGEEKPFSEFRKQSSKKDGLKNDCKICDSLRAKKYYDQDPKAISRRVMAAREKKREHYNLATSQYFKNNPIQRIRKSLRSRLREKTKIPSPIGCSSKELKLHLEKQFQEGMSWDTYGKNWCISHVKSWKGFDLNSPEEVAKINHYTNLKVSPYQEHQKIHEAQKIPTYFQK